MKRRSFLKLFGGACGAALWRPSLSLAKGTGNNTASDAMFIDREMLSGRNQNRSTVTCQNGIVCASQPLAAVAGIDILKAGGNAIDAAVCANAMLSLVEPMSCGPGGDLFAIVWVEKDKKLYGLNASGRSPYDWNLKELRKLGLKRIPPNGPLSWSVPGCVSGWDALLSRFGKRSMAKVLEAPISYAREGFPLSPLIASYDSNWSFDAQKYPTLAKTYKPNGKPPKFGDIFRNLNLASFFEIIARDGADAFYKGQIAERIVRFSEANGGYFSMRDFHGHTISWVEPAGANYRGYDVWEIPPNGQGIAALQILNILENFDIGSLEPNSADHLHLFIEAKKLAFEDRAVYYADMDFADVPLEQLISKEYAKERAKLIDPKRASQKVTAGRLPASADTVYLTAADKDGNMISLIQSIAGWWGSCIVPAELGFCLQNRGAAFAADPNHRNKLEPHKRPFHTIIPAFVTRQAKPVFSFGVMMGDFQPQGHAQVLMNIIDFGMSPQQAGEQPRVRHYESSTPTGYKMAAGGTIAFERHIPDPVKVELALRGHRFHTSDGGFGTGAFGGYQGIWRKENPRRYFGGSDSRLDGCAIGY